ncbi:hypothetical protein D3C78_1183540 [compost metagenome]
MQLDQFGQARAQQRLLAKGLLGHQEVATVVQLALHIVGHHFRHFIGQTCPALRAVVALREQLAQQHLGVLPQFGHVGRTAFHILGEGIGEQVFDVFEIVGGRRQRHPGLGRHRAVTHATHPLANDNAHGRVENVLAALLAALAAGLAALVLNAFGDRRGNASGTLLSHCRSHC